MIHLVYGIFTVKYTKCVKIEKIVCMFKYQY